MHRNGIGSIQFPGGVRDGLLRPSRLQAIAYWTATAVVAAEFATGGVSDIFHLPPFGPALVQLGYPAYVGVILGVWKLLGTAAILAPRLPRLKEWAYAGMIFDLTGAAASYLATGGGAGDIAVPLVFVVFVLASWALRPASRRLGG
jgi:uncharacterized membrane protein YphA (DoxX/SURF4 family)